MNDASYAATEYLGKNSPLRWALRLFLIVGGIALVGVLVWKGVTGAGVPAPEETSTDPRAAMLDISLLVFREGLECILVLSAIMASMRGPNETHKKPVFIGAAIGAVATLITWFAVKGVMHALLENLPALHVQAATGLLAIIVLLVVMNWFFHKVYWGGWISMHNRKKKELLAKAGTPEQTTRALVFGLGVLGFTSFYREGFEVILFLQTYRLRMGEEIVLYGCLIGLFFTAIVAVLNFIAHQKLPYRQMLVLTGVMLGVVLLVMVGEQVQEMQLAHWLPETPIPALEAILPEWVGMWFAVFPNWEGIIGQALAAALVIGSYVYARYEARLRQAEEAAAGEPQTADAV